MPKTATASPSLRDHLRVMLPRVAPVLLSPTVADRITRWSTAFPPVACMVECHLGVDEPRSDFLVRFLRAEAAAMTGADGVRPPVDTAADPATWARLGEFGRRWTEPGSPLSAFHQTWLEFDLPRPRGDNGSGAGLPVPSFFADVAPAAGSVAAAETALEILCGGADPALLGTIATCVEELPPGARWLSLGVMLGRPAGTVRVCVADLTAEAVPGYLRRVGWPGSVTRLAAISAALDGFTGLVTLALDVAASVRPRLGIEYNLEPRRSLHDSAATWRPFLDRLVEAGLCARHKRDPLLACVGFDHERIDPESWPAARRAESARYGPNVLSVLLRRLAHVKVVYEPEPALYAAKAYLELTHDWLTYDPATRQARFTARRDEGEG